MNTRNLLSIGLTTFSIVLFSFFIYQSGAHVPLRAQTSRAVPPIAQAGPSDITLLVIASIFGILLLTLLVIALVKKHQQRPEPFGPLIGLTQGLVGLQWLLTGISLWRSPNFTNRFTIDLAETIHAARGNDWYHNLVDIYLVPQGSTLATIVVALEIAIGVILFLGAIDWIFGHRIIRRWFHATITIIVLVALVLGLFLDYNIALVQGSALGTAGTLQKAIPFDFFLIVLSIVLIGADLIDLKRRGEREETSEEPEAKPLVIPAGPVAEDEAEREATSADFPLSQGISDALLPAKPTGPPPAASQTKPGSQFPTTDTPLAPLQTPTPVTQTSAKPSQSIQPSSTKASRPSVQPSQPTSPGSGASTPPPSSTQKPVSLPARPPNPPATPNQPPAAA